MTASLQATIEREVTASPEPVLDAYLLGAAHDGHRSQSHPTFRFAQRGTEWLRVIGQSLERLGNKSWSYQEGERGVWVLETSWMPIRRAFLSESELCAYARGYFDAEGGVPHSPEARFYIQFVQKELGDLSELRGILEDLGIRCGRIHNPSWRVDPSYWRFFVRTDSHPAFAEAISSWHPSRRMRLERRFSVE